MPNNVRSMVRVLGPRASREAFVAACLSVGEEEVVDFEKVIPIPPELCVVDSSSGDFGYTLLKYGWRSFQKRFKAKTKKGVIAAAEKVMPGAIELGRRYLENEKKFGSKTWYGWCTSKWGTKWNAYRSSIKQTARLLTLEFCTAWSEPMPVFRCWSEKFPDLRFRVHVSGEVAKETSFELCKGVEVEL